MTREEWFQKMEDILLEKGEKALEAFVIEHFAELPEDIQGKALMMFYSEAVQAEMGKAKIAEIQREGIDALQQIDSIKSSLSEQG